MPVWILVLLGVYGFGVVVTFVSSFSAFLTLGSFQNDTSLGAVPVPLLFFISIVYAIFWPLLATYAFFKEIF